MAKEVDLVSKEYEHIVITPAAAGSAGEVLKVNDVNGFLITDFTAAMLAAGEDATLITKAEKCIVAKTTPEVWAAGEPVYFDTATSLFTNVAGALDVVGHIVEAAASADATGVINFDGFAEFLKT